jgi:hypothetical protein
MKATVKPVYVTRLQPAAGRKARQSRGVQYPTTEPFPDGVCTISLQNKH